MGYAMWWNASQQDGRGHPARTMVKVRVERECEGMTNNLVSFTTPG